MVAENGAVAGEGCEGMQEGVSFFCPCFGCQFFWGETQCVFDIWVYELVDDFDAFEEGPPWDEGIEWSISISIERSGEEGTYPARVMMF